MKAISLRQPYASLWVAGTKVHETRAFRTRHRGWLLVHAAKTMDGEDGTDLAALCSRTLGGDGWAERLPRGGLIGAVYVGRCEPSGLASQTAGRDDLLCGDFSPGRWAWRAELTIAFAQPITFRGSLGLFEVPDTLIVEREPMAWGAMQ